VAGAEKARAGLNIPAVKKALATNNTDAGI